MRKTNSSSPLSPARLDEATSFAVTLMEHLVVPTFVLDADGRVIVWNKACERLTRVAASDVLGTREHWRAFYDEPRACLADLVVSGDYEAIELLYTTHEDPTMPAYGVHAENWCRMPRRGDQRYLAVDAGPVFGADGRLLAVVETLRDITEKKLAESEVQAQADQLRRHYETTRREADLARRILEHQIRVDLIRQAGVQYSVMPATNFSGDLVLAARGPSGAQYALLADATGHGLAATVSVLPMVQEFYRLVEQERPLVGIVESLGFMLAGSLPLGRFVAAAFVRVDEAARRGEVWVGGVPDVLLVDMAGAPLLRFASQHLPLGVACDVPDVGAPESFAWDAPCRLLMLSDGVIEAENREGQPFGDARLLAALARIGRARVVPGLESALRSHLDGMSAHDDMSIVAIDCPAA